MKNYKKSQGSVETGYEKELDKLLPKTSVAAYSYFDIDQFAAPEPCISMEEHKRIVLEALKRYGMRKHEIDVIILRVVYSLTFEEIAKALKLVSLSAARRIWFQSLKLLLERNFKFHSPEE